MLTNLLENAVRFSPPGGEVLVTRGAVARRVQVRVADQGPGIPVTERERVFEAFYRGDADERPGTGLGLAIARAIVARARRADLDRGRADRRRRRHRRAADLGRGPGAA